MYTSVKKRKSHDDDDDDSRPIKIVPTSYNGDKPPITVYILPDCITPKRLDVMTKNVEKMGFTLSARMTYYQCVLKLCHYSLKFSIFMHRARVTHVVSELESKEEVLKCKEFKKFRSWKGYILDAQWLAECVK